MKKNKKNNFVCGIDWLQYRGIFKFKNKVDESQSWQINDVFISKKDGRTSDFQSLYNVQYCDEDTGELIDFACICADWNFAEKLHKDLQVVKIYNHIFYMYEIEDIMSILNSFFYCEKIMRIDFYADFKRFKNCECQSLIKKVANNDLLIKGGRTTQIISKNGKYESATFGTRNTPVRCYIYNKTKELKQSGKQYIAEMHELNNLNPAESDVWRLEFSILQPNNILLIQDNDECGTFAGLNMCKFNPARFFAIFQTFVCRYFTFRTNSSRRKTQEFTPLLSEIIYPNVYLKRRKYMSKKVSRTNKTILKAIAKLNDELRTFRMQQITPEQINYFIHTRNLDRYAAENLII